MKMVGKETNLQLNITDVSV